MKVNAEFRVVLRLVQNVLQTDRVVLAKHRLETSQLALQPWQALELRQYPALHLHAHRGGSAVDPLRRLHPHLPRRARRPLDQLLQRMSGHCVMAQRSDPITKDVMLACVTWKLFHHFR
eukprot:CAMPEP_0196780670 /NCGR_PEP_ID=MMETSP1104-20130614/8369_1 /TAXON_ID=33652 /ORGANISM="Cafeteria sp., Strain Caron Lab Isolate" /LENGTH=118 /DNA_ID=CAMNT_0042150885 /DNA_START=85 /DNA_END=437 /DNA_ORIENTATION=-